jgi:hypothetical protein
VAQVVKYLLKKCETLNSNPSTAKNKNNRKQGWQSACLASIRPRVPTAVLPRQITLTYFGGIVIFIKVLTIYLSWIHPSITLLYPLSPSKITFIRR